MGLDLPSNPDLSLQPPASSQAGAASLLPTSGTARNILEAGQLRQLFSPCSAPSPAPVSPVIGSFPHIFIQRGCFQYGKQQKLNTPAPSTIHRALGSLAKAPAWGLLAREGVPPSVARPVPLKRTMSVK